MTLRRDEHYAHLASQSFSTDFLKKLLFVRFIILIINWLFFEFLNSLHDSIDKVRRVKNCLVH